MSIQVILVVSLLCQLAGAVAALSLIRITGKRWAWLLICAAIVLMAGRRILSIYRFLTEDPTHSPDLSAEVIALVISILQLAGLLLLAPFFRSMQRSERALAESRARFRQLVEATREGVAITEGGLIVDANRSFAETFGYQLEELIGRPVTNLVEPKSLERLHRDSEVGSNKPYEHTGLRKDGSVFSVETCLRSLDFDGRTIQIATIRDISERKQAENAVRESRRALLTLMGNLPGMVYRCRNDRDWTMEFISEGCFDLTGFRPDEVVNNRVVSYADLIHPDDREMVWNEVQVGVAERRPFRLHYRIRNAANEEKWVWEQGVGVFGAEGQFVAIEGFITDVTDRWRAEQALRAARDQLELRVQERTSDLRKTNEQLQEEIHERNRVAQALRASEERFRLLSNSAPIGIFLTNARGETVYTNPRLQQISGLTADEALGWGWLTMLHPDDREKVTAAASASARSGGEVNLEFRIRRRDDEVRWVHAQNARIIGEDGALQGKVGTVEDITERRLAEQALRERESHHALILRSVPIALYTARIDNGLSTVWISDQIERISGFAPQQFTADSAFWMGRMHPDDHDRVLNDLERVKHGETVATEYRWRAADGDYRWWLDQPVLIRDEGGNNVEIIGTVLDITERKQASEALRDSQRRLQGILDNSTAVIFVKDAQGKFILVNRRFTELFHFAAQYVLGKTDYDLFPKEMADAFRINDLRVLEGRVPVEFEETAPHDDGIHTYISLKFPLMNDDGVPYAVCGISTDITDRKRAEVALHRQQTELQAILDSAPAMIWFKSCDDRILRVNNAAAQSIGMDVRDIEGRYTSEIYPERAAQYRQDDLEVIRTRVPKRGIIEQLRTATGETLWIQTDKAPLRDESDQIIGVIVVAQDITDRKRAEQAVRESSNRLAALAQEQRTLLEHTRDFVYRHDENGVFNFVSASVEQITGYTVPEWRTHYSSYLTDNPINTQVVDHTQETLRTGQESPPYLVELRHKRGHAITLEVNERAYFDRGRIAGIIGVARDVSERVRAAAEMQKAKEAAEAASRAKSIFLANMSHEIRTPIMAMLGAAELSRSDSRTAGTLDRRDVILRNGRHLLALVDGILDLARLDADRLEVRPGPCSVLEILADVCAVSAPLIQRRDLDFRVICEGPIPTTIRSDGTRIRQALINLVNNAIKFTPHGHVHVRVRADAEAQRLSLAVEDSGVGIPPGELEHIFETFAQLEPLTHDVSQGVGLGLPLTRGIARQLGGDVTVTSMPGRGSTFTLEIATGPLDEVEWVTPDQALTFVNRPATPDLTTLGLQLRGSVLVAEDFADTRELIEAALEEAGVDVTAVGNGRQALRAAIDRTFDLILMDVRMPEMDGLTAAAELRRAGCQTNMIALTASTNPGERDRILDAGFDDLWPKPISLLDLVREASAYLEAVPIGAADSDGTRQGRGRKEPTGTRSFQQRIAAAVAEFSRSLPQRVARVRQALTNGDCPAAREILHQLAGSGGIHGLMSVSDEAARLLSLAREGTLIDRIEELEPLESLAAKIAADAAPQAQKTSLDG